MAELGALEDRVADLDKRVSIHEAVCEKNQLELRSGIAEIRLAVATLTARIETTSLQLATRAASGDGGSKAVRETVAYAITLITLALAALSASGHIHFN